MVKESSPKTIIALLNDALCAELTAINQYFMHAELCRHWGYTKLYAKMRQESISEMKHAEVLMERILFLNGMPNLQKLGKVNVGETVTEQFKSDLALEIDAIDRLNKGIQVCQQAGENGTAILFQELLKSEEEHLEWINVQLDLIAALGEKNYLTQQL